MDEEQGTGTEPAEGTPVDEGTDAPATEAEAPTPIRAENTLRHRRHALRDEINGVMNLLMLNGELSHATSVLRGVSGLSQEQQVERLTESRDKATAGLTAAFAAIEEAKTKLTAIQSELPAHFEDAIAFAANRDFAEHQARKHAAGVAYGESEVTDDEDYDSDDED